MDTEQVQTHYALLNRCLLIFRALILESSVDCGIPSLAAAPEGPETLPLLAASAASMSSFSWAAILWERGCLPESAGIARWPSQLSSIERFSESEMITER